MVDSLKLEQSHTMNLNTRLKTGTNENRRKPAYVQLDERINKIVADYEADDLESFFENMCLNVEYV